jgi:hypothetical protein
VRPSLGPFNHTLAAEDKTKKRNPSWRDMGDGSIAGGELKISSGLGLTGIGFLRKAGQSHDIWRLKGVEMAD